MRPDFDAKARRLLRAMDIFCVVQILSLPVGMACTRLIGFGAGTVLEFAQVIATILFLLVFSWRGDSLISAQYPDLEYYRVQIRRRIDPYTPLVRAAAAGQGDGLTPKLLKRRLPAMLRAAVLLFVMALLESFLTR